MYFYLILFTHIKSKAINKGFTLIELLVVVIIVGILATVALPNFLIQVGKARETEAKTNLSSIGQSQQAYFLEKSTFADQISKLVLNLPTNGAYTFPDPVSADTSLVKHTAINPTALDQSTRNYSMGVYFFSGDFGIVLCQSSDIGGVAEAPSTFTNTCIDGVQIK